MGSIPGSFLAGRHSNKTTTVQRICIDQNSGQVRQMRCALGKSYWGIGKNSREMGEPAARRRLSSAMELVGGKLKSGAGGTSRGKTKAEVGSENWQQEMANLHRRLADMERAKGELEMRLRVLEREKRELEEEMARSGDFRRAGMPNLVEQVGNGSSEGECQCGWKWEEQLAQRLKERDEIWAKRLAEEAGRRRKLMERLGAELGEREVAELMGRIGRAEEGAEEQKQHTEGGAHQSNGRFPKLADPCLRTCSVSTPPTRLSTSSTIQSARVEQPSHSHTQPTAIFRPMLRRQALAGGKGLAAVDLEGICLNEDGERCNGGTLLEELEGEEEVALAHQPAQEKQTEQRRASTSAKSRDSGISY